MAILGHEIVEIEKAFLTNADAQLSYYVKNIVAIILFHSVQFKQISY